MRAIILLGPPGAGKGTVSKVLAEREYIHISTGELLRQQIAEGTELGLAAKERMDRGEFVSDEIVIGMVRDLLEHAKPGMKFLFDGFPRTLVQAEKFDELVESLGGGLEEVILLECDDEVIVERLSGRRICETCGTVYHVIHNPPQKAGICDLDGGTLLLRPDDAPDTVRNRLSVYRKQTAPLIEFYRSGKGLLHTVDAAQSIDLVRKEVLEHLV